MVGYRPRHRSPEKVVDEIEHLLTYGFNRINVADDLFTANKKRARALCVEIIRRGLKFNWSAFCRVNTVDPETLEAMKNAGCDSISFGIESGNPEMLKRIRKGITLEQARNAIRYCRETGIEPHASFMIGLPGETFDTMRDSSEFAEGLEIEYGYHMLAPFPGTTVREEIDQYDLEILTDDWDLYDANRAIVRTSGLSDEEMNTFLAEFEKSRYDRWDQVKIRCREDRGTPLEALQVEGHYRMHLIFKLLSMDIIADEGTFPTDGHDPIEELSRRVALISGDEPEFVSRTLRSLLQDGYLKYHRIDSQVRWYWTHNNRTDRLPAGSA